MRIAVVGGGPGGLYLASWAKQFDPAGEVVVWERNPEGDTFGFGVVFSDGTLLGIKETDPALYDAMAARSERWADIAVRYRGEVVRSAGHGFAAIGRKELLRLLYRRCAESGVMLRFGEQGPPVERLLAEYDLVVAADGANSAIRSGRSDAFGTSLDTRSSRYIWLAVDKPFDALTFLVAESGHGALHGHAYPFSAELSTFIVEADEHSWRAAGLAAPVAGLTPDGSDRFAVERLEEIFADALDGHRLTGNRSRWRRFTVVRNRRWHQGIWCCSGMPPTRRTSPSGRAPGSPWRTPWRWRACSGTTAVSVAAVRRRPRSSRTSGGAGPPWRRRSGPRRPAWNGSRTSAWPWGGRRRSSRSSCSRAVGGCPTKT